MNSGTDPREPRGHEPWGADLESLRRTTERDLPSIDETARTLRARATRGAREGGFVMQALRSLRARPAVATAAGVVITAVALLAVPISYQRTVGYEARLSFPADAVDAAGCDAIAAEFAALLKTADYAYAVERGQATVAARVPVRDRHVAEGLAMAYTQSLAMRGLRAASRVEPIVARVTGNVYAAAANEIIEIRVNREGKMPAQIEEEIRQQLAAAGLPGAQVEVTQEGDQFRMQMRWEASPGDEPIGEKEFHITFDGHEEANGRQAFVKMQPSEPMSDADMETEIERQLRDQGHEVDATVRDGKVVDIERR